MSSYNRIVLMGNLTRDPEISFTPSGTAVCKFGIATNRKWKDSTGAEREDVCFVDCTLFGKRGEAFGRYHSKGQSALIEGRLQLNQWTTPEGDKRSKHGVLVDSFEFVGGARRESASGSEAPAMAGSHNDPPPPSDADIPF
jgi:single-strand DNA-binding protein